MRTTLPLLSLALGLTIASTPAFADDDRQAHHQQARSHEGQGSRDDRDARDARNARNARDEAEHARDAHARVAHARAAHAHAERARDAHARAAHAHAQQARAAHYRATHPRVVVTHRAPPPPPRRVVVTESPAHRSRPANFVDRAGQFSLGLAGGSYVSGYESGSSYGDFGLGLVGRYRATPALGFEAAWSHYRDGAGERATSPLSLSFEAFGYPTSRVNPYFLAGVTFTGRHIEDTFCEGEDFTTLTTDDTLFGPHAGLGLEIAVGKNATIDLEGRVTSYLDVGPEDPTVPASLQGKVGFNFYF